MKEETIVAVIKNVGEECKVVTIANELKSFQDVVKGYIEVYPLREDILIICNEEGRLQNLELNFPVHCKNGYTEYIVGNVVFVSNDGVEFGSLNEEQISFIKKEIKLL